MLGNQPGSSGRTASILNHGAISSASCCFPLMGFSPQVSTPLTLLRSESHCSGVGWCLPWLFLLTLVFTFWLLCCCSLCSCLQSTRTRDCDVRDYSGPFVKPCAWKRLRSLWMNKYPGPCSVLGVHLQNSLLELVTMLVFYLVFLYFFYVCATKV